MPLNEITEPMLEDETLIRRYMLGEVSEDERTTIEKRLMTDPAYLDRLRLVETDLADEYASGALRGRERKHFERHFLSAPQHRQRVRVAAALRSYGAAQREAEAKPSRLQLPIGWRFSPAAAFGLTAITLVLAGVMVFQLIQAGRMRNEIQRLEALAREQESQLQDLTQQAESVRSRNAELEQEIAELATSGEEALSLRDGGGSVTLDRRGTLRGLEALPSTTRDAIKVALESGRARMPDSVAELAGSRSVLMGITEGEGVPFALLSPVATGILEQRPRFRWSELKGAAGYTVSVFDADFRRVARSELLAQTEWQIPQSLDRGGQFSWQVTAIKDGSEVISPVKPAPEARFRVLDSAAAEEVDRYRRSGTVSHLAAGIVYARAGLREDAEREFRRLVKENPGSSVAHRLLRSVK